MKSVSGHGWRIWNRKMDKWCGNWFPVQPDELVQELNGQKRPDVIVKLTQKYSSKK